MNTQKIRVIAPVMVHYANSASVLCKKCGQSSILTFLFLHFKIYRQMGQDATLRSVVAGSNKSSSFYFLGECTAKIWFLFGFEVGFWLALMASFDVKAKRKGHASIMLVSVPNRNITK